MSMKLRASSGTYNVRASEMSRDRPVSKTVKCVVHFLDESETAFEIDKRAKAQTLLDKVFEHLELVEKDYFGLQFVDNAPAPDGMVLSHISDSLPIITADTMRWLDPLKTFKKQIRVGPPYSLYFRVKFYVSDPSKLQEEYTRYHFFLQLKKDIVEGKLVVPYKTAVHLASCAVQSELGDYNAEEHKGGYLSEFRFLPGQTEEFERDVAALHKEHRGLTPAECEALFLDDIKQCDTYGVDLHQAFWVRDQNNLEIQLGVTSAGLVVFQNNVRINTFSWAKIVKISFKRKQFFIQLRKEINDNVENLIGFNMVSYRSCKNLWKSCVEHHTFFRLHLPPPVKNSLLALGSKFRYSGRTEFQTIEDGKRKARLEKSFVRSPSKRYARRTVGGSSRDTVIEERNAIDGNRNMPQSQSLDNFRPGDSYTGRGQSPTKTVASLPNSSSYPHALRSTPHNNNNTGNGGFQHANHVRKTLPTDYKPSDYAAAKSNGGNTLTRNAPSTTSPPRQQGGASSASSASASSSVHARNLTNISSVTNPSTLASQGGGGGGGVVLGTNKSALMEPERTPRSLEAKTDYRLSRTVERSDPARISLERSEPRASRLYGETANSSHNASVASARTSKTFDMRSNGPPSDKASESGFNTDSLRSSRSVRSQDTIKEAPTFVPAIPPKMIGYMDDDSSLLTDPSSYDVPAYNNDYVPNGNGLGDASHNGLVTIRMQPDKQGRFGFNVKGGADQGMPIIVSRVAPDTPADVCIPRLNEGDQVLFINGRDVSQHTHEQVVMFIRASREKHSGELVLVVRPNVYIGDDTSEEPDFQYIPDTHHITSTLPPGGDPLQGSLMLLQESLDSGAALAQFEQLYRKKPGMTMNAARLSDSIPRNRYRDISPYDQTRVKLKGVTAGDYINANFVHMEIPKSGVVNRYIAAQGPLPNTCTDFWLMVWEQQSRLIVMLTTKVERGRVKCHQYWPELYDTASFGGLQVTCLREEITPSFAFREFTLVNLQVSNEERHIQQMQYISWPDHGVPDDSSDFLDYVIRVRQNRVGMVEPTIVHCSAGIGRTGVLITMETAMCLIEANHPVYPLDIVRQMRDQRAMLIQTSSQYKFVCEAILRVYNEKIVQPLEDYKR